MAERPRGPMYPGATQAPASCAELFRVFTGMAMQGFGGVLAVAQHVLVERRRWMDKAQFVELLSVAQVLPGPNVVNLAMMVGDRYFGWRGAMAALTGMLAAPLVLVLLLAALYSEFAAMPRVAGALRGMGAVAAGLVIATALKLLPSLKHNAMGRGWCAVFALLTLVGITVLRWPMVWVIAMLGMAAVGCAWWRLRPR
jgi:chromate transporter